MPATVSHPRSGRATLPGEKVDVGIAPNAVADCGGPAAKLGRVGALTRSDRARAPAYPSTGLQAGRVAS